MMRLGELLRECRRTFLAQCSAEMKRDGISPKEAEEILDSTGSLLDEYNDHVLITLAGAAEVVELAPAKDGGAQA